MGGDIPDLRMQQTKNVIFFSFYLVGFNHAYSCVQTMSVSIYKRNQQHPIYSRTKFRPFFFLLLLLLLINIFFLALPSRQRKTFHSRRPAGKEGKEEPGLIGTSACCRGSLKRFFFFFSSFFFVFI